MSTVPPSVVAGADQAHARIRAALEQIVAGWHTDRGNLTASLAAEASPRTRCG